MYVKPMLGLAAMVIGVIGCAVMAFLEWQHLEPYYAVGGIISAAVFAVGSIIFGLGFRNAGRLK